MALTPSTMLELGTRAPSFELPDFDGRRFALPADGQAAATLVIFMCNHCPYVIHLKEHLTGFARRYMDKGVSVYAINSNNVDRYPADSPTKMREDARHYAYPFPYLYDADQAVARAYRAACTPDFFLFDRDLKLAYRGQYDASRPGNGKPVTGEDLGRAIDCVLSGQPVPGMQRPSMGCNIKWKPGNEPDYFA